MHSSLSLVFIMGLKVRDKNDVHDHFSNYGILTLLVLICSDHPYDQKPYSRFEKLT